MLLLVISAFSSWPHILWGLPYAVLILYILARILLETHSTPKTLGYIILVLFFPVIGVFFYFAFGTNYMYRRMRMTMDALRNDFRGKYLEETREHAEKLLQTHPGILDRHADVIRFLCNLGTEGLDGNEFRLLVNGEEKFPDVIEHLRMAKQFIHLEYYIWENDTRGNQIKEVLLKKAGEGVAVRVLYDAYASRKIRNNLVKELRAGGVEVQPVIRIRLPAFIHRVNHRDHRKVIIIDGHTGYVGGINISDRYDNSIDTGLYWRDTHLRITGPTVNSLQRHFLVNWYLSHSMTPEFPAEMFPVSISPEADPKEFAQVVSGGPMCPLPDVMLAYTRIVTLTQERLYITTPYFIPSDSLLDALRQAAVCGVDVRLMMPENSDSALVSAASKFYYSDLLRAGVRVFLYGRGFVHAKTLVADSSLSVVGTANMDIRSFDLNLEIMAVVYGEKFGNQLEHVFLEDLKYCREVTYEEWSQISTLKRLGYSLARLISAFL